MKEGGQSITSFVKASAFLNTNIFSASLSEQKKHVMAKGFEIFAHAIKINPTKGYGCNLSCPEELKPGEKEDDFPNVFECHVMDGLNMGMTLERKRLRDAL